jgi:hypothetical protein
LKKKLGPQEGTSTGITSIQITEKSFSSAGAHPRDIGRDHAPNEAETPFDSGLGCTSSISVFWSKNFFQSTRERNSNFDSAQCYAVMYLEKSSVVEWELKKSEMSVIETVTFCCESMVALNREEGDITNKPSKTR